MFLSLILLFQISLLEKLRPGIHAGVFLQDGDDPGKINVLGKKSFWLESLRAAVQERQRVETERASRARFKPSLHRTTAPPPPELLQTPLVDRREKFFSDLKKESEKVPTIRDDITDVEEDRDEEPEELVAGGGGRRK